MEDVRMKVKNHKPLVSIITPTYNSQNFIGHTIDSVVNQTFENWELIIIDDASTDQTNEKIKSFITKDKRISLIENTLNQGAAITRNLGLESAKGRYIAFLDSDDIWTPNKLKVQLEFMRKKSAAISFTTYELIDESGKRLNRTIRSVPSLNYYSHFKDTRICMSTSMIDQSLIKSKIEFIDIRTRQDCYLWISLLRDGHLAYGINEVLAFYRVRKGSISSNKIKAAKMVWYLYYKLEKLGFVKSLYYFSFYAFNAFKKRLFG